jgi:hypothetical protein
MSSLGPLGDTTKDPLDELGGLVGQTLNLFDGAGTATKSPEHPLDVLGAIPRATAGTDNLIGQSMDLDLLGTPSTSQTAVGALAHSNTFGPLEAEVQLNDEVEVGLTHAIEQAQAASSSSPQSETRETAVLSFSATGLFATAERANAVITSCVLYV